MKPRNCYAFAWVNGRIRISSTLPANAMPIAKGPRQGLHALISPRATFDDSGLRVPLVNDRMNSREAIEAITTWSEGLSRYHRDPEITLI